MRLGFCFWIRRLLFRCLIEKDQWIASGWCWNSFLYSGKFRFESYLCFVNCYCWHWIRFVVTSLDDVIAIDSIALNLMMFENFIQRRLRLMEVLIGWYVDEIIVMGRLNCFVRILHRLIDIVENHLCMNLDVLQDDPAFRNRLMVIEYRYILFWMVISFLCFRIVCYFVLLQLFTFLIRIKISALSFLYFFHYHC